MTDENQTPETPATSSRREFLTKAGKAAVIVPPAMTVLLSTTMSSEAIAKSGKHSSGGQNGGYNGGYSTSWFWSWIKSWWN